jgi:2-iminobutanoate/2-iminopropanoate deaminase
MIEVFDPPDVHRPASAYSQGALVTGPAKWLHVSGQIGVRPDGSVPETLGEQMEQMWDNLFAVLAHAGMSHRDLVKTTVFLVDQRDVKLWRQVRDRRMEGHACAATLLIVHGLASPQLFCEIEAVACQPL